MTATDLPPHLPELMRAAGCLVLPRYGQCFGRASASGGRSGTRCGRKSATRHLGVRHENSSAHAHRRYVGSSRPVGGRLRPSTSSAGRPVPCGRGPRALPPRAHRQRRLRRHRLRPLRTRRQGAPPCGAEQHHWRTRRPVARHLRRGSLPRWPAAALVRSAPLGPPNHHARLQRVEPVRSPRYSSPAR